MKFDYVAINQNGQQACGQDEAASAEELRARLVAQGYSVESVEPTVDDATESVQETVSPDGPVKLSGRDSREIAQHIADLAEAELPLAAGLRAIAAETSRSKQRRGLIYVARQIESGRNLSSILQSQKAPRDLCAIIDVGVHTGSAGEAIGEYMAHVRAVGSLRTRVLLSLAYPVLLCGLIGGMLSFVMIWVVPQFKEIFDDFGVVLPAITELLISVSDLISYGAPYLLLGLAPIGVVLVVSWLILSTPALRRSYLGRIPLIGTVFRWTALARFSHLFAVLLDHQMPLPQALRSAGVGADDADIERASEEMAQHIEAGEPVVSTGFSLRGFPTSIVKMLSWRTDHRGYSQAMHAMADMYEGRVRVQATFIAMALQPVLFVMLAVSVMFIVLALFMPLIKMLNGLV